VEYYEFNCASSATWTWKKAITFHFEL